MIENPICSRFSLHKVVHVKFFWTQFKNVHLRGPCSLRPCISRPYCIQLNLTRMTFSNAFVCYWKQAKSEPLKPQWRKALQKWAQWAWIPYLFQSELLVQVRKRTKSEKSFYIFFQKETMSTKVALIQGSNPGLGSQWNEVISKKILWTHDTNKIAKTLWPCHPLNNCFVGHTICFDV